MEYLPVVGFLIFVSVISYFLGYLQGRASSKYQMDEVLRRLPAMIVDLVNSLPNVSFTPGASPSSTYINPDCDQKDDRRLRAGGRNPV